MRHPPRTDIQELPQCRWIVAEFDEDTQLWTGFRGGSKKNPSLEQVYTPSLKELADAGVPVHRTRSGAMGRAWRLDQARARL